MWLVGHVASSVVCSERIFTLWAEGAVATAPLRGVLLPRVCHSGHTTVTGGAKAAF